MPRGWIIVDKEVANPKCYGAPAKKGKNESPMGGK